MFFQEKEIEPYRCFKGFWPNSLIYSSLLFYESMQGKYLTHADSMAHLAPLACHHI